MDIAKEEITLAYKLQYQRRQTRTVNVKDIAIGSDHNILIQSMLISHSYDVASCLQEIKSLVKHGCQMIRLCLLSRRELNAVAELKTVLANEGIDIPLVADVHFAGHLAYDACEIFDKIRINPGNYSDRPKNFKQGQLEQKSSQQDFELGREKLKQKIEPFAKNLLKYNRALRIGVNQGSLSSRMIQRYGDTPQAMVNSALEALEIFEQFGVQDIVVSLKSSNPFVAARAYRLFAALNKGVDAVPLHLGVTEAGNDSIARTKSVCGIGQLLVDGIGDTIRISLSEPSVNEIIFAKKFLKSLQPHLQKNDSANTRYFSKSLQNYRMQNPAVEQAGIKIGDSSPPKIGVPSKIAESNLSSFDYDFLYSRDQKYLSITCGDASYDYKYSATVAGDSLIVQELKDDFYQLRKFYLENYPLPKPLGIILPDNIVAEDFSLEIQLSSAICEGLVDFILIPPNIEQSMIVRLQEILQATRLKMSTADYVSCPSCGRTMFDLQVVTDQIKAKTSHLKGVKIGVLGCIVNGPGEMADADFGYVGSSAGKIDLYLGHKRVRQNIPTDQALTALIDLIKAEGRWIDE